MTVERDCANCGARITVRPCDGNKLYCSRACWKADLREQACDPAAIALRFWRHVNLKGPVPAHRPELGECHVWTGKANVNGYGLFRVSGRNELAHRFAFFLADGRMPDPQGLHRCDNHACVRRSHLFEGTQADNQADMAAKGRGRKPLAARNQ